MKSSIKALLGTTALALIASAGIGAAPAEAATCPALGVDTNCGLIITIGPGGTLSIVATGQGPYDSSEDTLIGVVNTSGVLQTKIHVASTDTGAFGLDGDGIDVYPGAVGNASDTTGYGGPISFFTNIGVGCVAGTVCGDVNFTGGTSTGLPSGTGSTAGSPNVTYFSLEHALTATSLIGGPPALATPEPATLALFGAGLAGLGALRRRKAKKA